MTLDPVRQELHRKQTRVAPLFRREMEQSLKRAAPKRTRELEQSISVTIETPLSLGKPAPEIRFRAEATADHARYTVEGTRPHVIRGNPILAFFWEKVGRFVYFAKVNHPGTKPNPWWPNTLERTGELLRDLWRRV